MRQSRLKYFGQELERVFGGAEAKGILFAPRIGSTFAATHVQSSISMDGDCPRIPCERSFLVEVQLEKPDSSGWVSWTSGKSIASPELQVGAVSIYDLELEHQLCRNSQFESVHFNVPKTTLESYVEGTQLSALRSLSSSDGKTDSAMLHMSRLIGTYLLDQRTPSESFLRHFLQMLCDHLISGYGTSADSQLISKGGLAPWQKRRALELLEANLSGDLRLARLAAECGLSASYFCRCFRTTFGTSVHKYVVKRRAARAKELLLAESMSLAEIAIETGFSDQAAFSRAFMAAVGTPPAKWRTEQRVARRSNLGLDAKTFGLPDGLKRALTQTRSDLFGLPGRTSSIPASLSTRERNAVPQRQPALASI